jgi:hypothetical protein
VFPVKYRKALPDDEVERIIVETAQAISERYDIEFEQIGCDGNHIHLLCSAHPKLAPGQIVRVFKSLRTCLKSSQYENQKGEVDKLQAGIEFSLAVFPQSPAFFQPGKGTLYNPSLGQYDKSVKFVALDDFHRCAQLLLDGPGKGFSGVAAINQDLLNCSERMTASIKGFQCAIPVGNLGGCHCNRMGESLRIHRNMAFDARDFFPRVVPFLLRAVRILHALRVSDQQTGGGVASKALSGRANLIFLKPAQAGWESFPSIDSTNASNNRPIATGETLPAASATGSRS